MIEQLAGQMSIADLGISCGKMYPEHTPATEEKTSDAFSKKSAKSQITKFLFLNLTKASGSPLVLSWETGIPSRGVPSTPSIGPGPHNGGCASTLSQILQANVPEKYYLSKTACEGILRRAERRGKVLPQMLKEALEEVVSLSSSKNELDVRGGGKGILCDVGKTFTLSTMLDQSICVERSAGRSGGIKCLNPWDGNAIRQYDTNGVFLALRSNSGGGQNREGVVYALQANAIDRADTAGCNGAGWREDQCYTLNTIDRHAVCYRQGGFGEYLEGVAGTIRASGGDLGGGSENIAVCYAPKSALDENWDECNASPALRAEASKSSFACVYPTITGPLMANTHPGAVTGQDAFNNMLPVYPSPTPPRKYIVRRLTPVECARLQGFPDWWCMGLETPEPTEEDIAWAAEVWERWRLITSPNTKPKSRNQLIKWLKNPHSDAAEYKLWGNGIALPCAVRVMEGIVKEEHHEPED